MSHTNPASLPTEFPPRPQLSYPFGLKWAPEIGQPFEVAKGVFWLRMPLPMSLDHINLWLLRDKSGWVIVDTGVDHSSCKEVWEQVFSEFLRPCDVNYIVVTHFHPDHIGLASWLAIRCACEVRMTPGEFNHYRNIITRDQHKTTEVVREYFHRLGFDEKTREAIVGFFKNEEKPAEARLQPEQVSFINKGDVLIIGGGEWRIVIGNGHSPEHACLHNRSAGLLISGDQSLPRISSNVSLLPGGTVRDPLGDWLSSCERLRDLVPDSTTILPAHQEPFKDNPARMQHMIDEHYVQLNRLRLALTKPHTAIDARKEMFRRELNPTDTVLATGETMAHLKYLLERSEIQQAIDSNGVAWFSSEN